MLELDPRLQPRAYRPVFQRFGRLHIPGVLTEKAASAAARTLGGALDWRRSVHVDVGQDYDVPVSELEALTPEARADVERQLQAAAQDELRYVFDTVRITNELRAAREVAPELAEIAAFVNGRAFLDFVRAVTGDERPAFCDAMATRYLPGHYLTTHGDEHPEQKRLYAYVLNLTRAWRTDWGGLLLFLDEDDHVAEGYAPAWNALNLFRVPQRHSVSLVSPLARHPRLSITGWVHAAP